MNGSRVMVAILAVAIVIGGFSAGRLIGQLAAGQRSPQPVPTLTPAAAPLPEADVAGRDVPGLPRYPDSVRTDHERETDGESVRIAAAYLAQARRNEVRAFYIDAFHADSWEIVDLGFSGGTWTFVLERPPRQATVEIGTQGDLTAIRLEVIRPLPDATQEPTREPTPRPTPAPPPPPPPDDDEDDDDDGADDGDDSDDDGSDDDD
jgi:GAF domain-containing protein